MKISLICTFTCFFFHQLLPAQQNIAIDSARTLTEIVLPAFELNAPNGKLSKTKIINTQSAGNNTKISFLNELNSIAGVRMEERSPGSYRINIRGSSLRAPFGVRNVKIYWNNIPITDAGGNTYFNQFSFNNISSAEIVKGPAGSMYGAGTGGLMLLQTLPNIFEPKFSVEYITGSFGLHNILTSLTFGNDNKRSQVTYAHNQSDGYRNHTQTKKDNASFVTKIKINDKQQLSAAILVNNLFYQTPGALNINEYNNNPKMARPAAGAFPSAQTAQAAIYQKNFTAGITQQYRFTHNIKNTTTLFGSFAQIRNPTFRNYERRIEPGFGGRTSFNYNTNIKKIKVQLIAGAELQQAYFNVRVNKNNNGRADSLITNDDINYAVNSIFAQVSLSFINNWVITAGGSMNKSNVCITRLSINPAQDQRRKYKNEISPRLAIQKNTKYNTIFFASIANGFSPPTIAELLPSTGTISTFLEAEQGKNYEAGVKTSLLKNDLKLEATAYYFNLKNALVVRKDSSNADYFVNAGNTRQKGIELSADYKKNIKTKWLEHISVNAAYTLQRFKYHNFIKGVSDFSGKYLPGVPKNTFSILASVVFANRIYLNTVYYSASNIYLDDANMVTAPAYGLLGAKLGWTFKKKVKQSFNFYFGADNLLNATYSLGNDINAAAGRYFNAASKRNYYAGVVFQLSTKIKK